MSLTHKKSIPYLQDAFSADTYKELNKESKAPRNIRVEAIFVEKFETHERFFNCVPPQSHTIVIGNSAQ